MALEPFLMCLRIGAGFLYPSVIVDSPHLDPDQLKLEDMLRRADIWLTPKCVEGFDARDFNFLSDDERKRLSSSVDKFRIIASQVPLNDGATKDQYQEAFPAFKTILEIIRPDKYGDPDALKIGKTVDRQLNGALPDWVRELRYETGQDSNGDPAIWIWVEVEDEAAEASVFADNSRRVREQIEKCIRALGSEYWPFIRFRTVSEQADTRKRVAK